MNTVQLISKIYSEIFWFDNAKISLNVIKHQDIIYIIYHTDEPIISNLFYIFFDDKNRFSVEYTIYTAKSQILKDYIEKTTPFMAIDEHSIRVIQDLLQEFNRIRITGEK